MDKQTEIVIIIEELRFLYKCTKDQTLKEAIRLLKEYSKNIKKPRAYDISQKKKVRYGV